MASFTGTRVSGDIVGEACAYLESHYDEVITEPRLARLVGSSVKTLRSGFHARWGLTPMGRLRTIRVRHALDLLVNTNIKVEAVALTVGFRSKATLYRQLARRIRDTPAALRSTLHRDRDCRI